MMKKVLVLAMVLLLSGCISVGEKEERHSSMVVTVNGEIASAYRDGEDVTERRKFLKEQMEGTICRFLNRDREELEFDMFCLLGEDRMTMDVIVNEVSYTFTCNTNGDIIRVVRTYET